MVEDYGRCTVLDSDCLAIGMVFQVVLRNARLVFMGVGREVLKGAGRCVICPIR